MHKLLRDIPTEKLTSVGMDDSVQRALEAADNIGAIKIAVYDKENNFWVIPYWKLRLLDLNITLKQAYDEQKEIFEKVDTVSSDKEIAKVIKDLYEFLGLIVIDDENIKGFISLADFSESELKEIESPKKPSWTIEQIKQKAYTEGGLVGVDLRGADLSKIDLNHADLRDIDFSGADLSKANLEHADLTKANLTKANLTKANLNRAILSGANLTGAKLTWAKLNDVELKDATLNGADLRFAELWNADLENAKLKEANLKDAVLFRANLRSASLIGADLSEAGLMSAKLEEADLTNVKMYNANLKYAKFSGKHQLDNIDEINNVTTYSIKDPEIKKFLKEKYGY